MLLHIFIISDITSKSLSNIPQITDGVARSKSVLDSGGILWNEIWIVMQTALIVCFILCSDSETDTVEFRPLTYSYLEQYQSSVAFVSSHRQFCDDLTNCLSCLSDASCGWCYSQSKCIERSTIMGEKMQCAASGKLFGFSFY